MYKKNLKQIATFGLVIGILNLPLIWCYDEMISRFMEYSDNDHGISLLYTLLGLITYKLNLNQSYMAIVSLILTITIMANLIIRKKEKNIYKIFSIFFLSQIVIGINIWHIYLILFTPFALIYVFEKMGEIYLPKGLRDEVGNRVSLFNLIKRNIKVIYFILPFIPICVPIPHSAFYKVGLGGIADYKRSILTICFYDIFQHEWINQKLNL